MATRLADPLPGADSNQMCPKCGAVGYTSWCNKCGYYAVAGKSVDVDSEFECYDRQRYVAAEKPAASNTWAAVIAATPTWFWKLATVPVAVTVVAVLIRCLTAPGSALRVVAVVGMVVVGVCTFAAAHVAAGIRNMRRMSDFSFLDTFTCPVRLWLDLFRDLPKTFNYAALGLGGLWAFIIAHLIVGVPYLTLADFSAPPKKRYRDNGSGAAAMCAGGAATEVECESLDEALEELAGGDEAEADEEEPEAMTLEEALAEVFGDDESNSQDAASQESGEPEEETSAEAVTLRLRATSIGYSANQGRVSSLVVAVSSASGWRVPPMSVAVPIEAAGGLSRRFETIHRAEPFVENGQSATWVEPIVRCSIEAEYVKAEDRFTSVTLLKVH
jgi:hypothetical protein